jgi:hypothetical protein
VPTRFPRPVKSRRRAGNIRRQVVAVVIALAALIALGAVATDHYVTAARRASGLKVETASGDGIYTGSILYEHDDTNNICHQWLFDNQNGQITDNGNVNCDQAAYRGLDGPKQWSAGRLQVIRDGFVNH